MLSSPAHDAAVQRPSRRGRHLHGSSARAWQVGGAARSLARDLLGFRRSIERIIVNDRDAWFEDEYEGRCVSRGPSHDPTYNS